MRWNIYGVLLLIIVFSLEFCRSSASAEVLYGRKGSSVLLLGTEQSLQGNGVLEWKKDNKWMMTYHFESKKPESSHEYENRALLFVHNGSLKLQNLTKEDEAVYTLQVKFKDVRTMMLKVLEPVHSVSITRMPSDSNCTMQLVCKASGDVWNITWARNGNSLGQQVNMSVLTIRNLGIESGGTYTCTAQNPVSEDRYDYELQDIEKPLRLASFGCGITGLLLFFPHGLWAFLKYFCPSNRGARLLEIFLHTKSVSEILSVIPALIGHAVIAPKIIYTAAIFLTLLILACGLYILQRTCLKSCSCLLNNTGVEKVLNAAGPVMVFCSCFALIFIYIKYRNICDKSAHLLLTVVASIAVAVMSIMIILFYFYRKQHSNGDSKPCKNSMELSKGKVAVEQDGNHDEQLLQTHR